MIYLPPVREIEFIAVYEAGVPNRERMVFKALESVNLAQFAIVVAWQNPDTKLVTPLPNFFWLGDQILASPTMLYVYSGKGTPQIGQLPDGSPYVTSFLNQSATLFNRTELVPVLLRFDAINIGKHFDLATGKFVADQEKPLALPDFST